jgi:cytoskeletal protein RodZ
MARKKEQQIVDPIDAPMDDMADAEPATVGSQLRSAREARGLTLEDIAAQTRIPRRHLESLEVSDWQRLPAPTYTMGFAKSYASAVGLDRTEVAESLRDEMGGVRPVHTTASEVFEPADPARTMPKWLVFGAIAAVLVLVLVMSWLNDRSVRGDDEGPAENAPAATAPQAAGPAAAPAMPAAQGPVVITANDQVWLQVKDGATILKAGVLEAGQSFEVPASAQAPVLTTGKPEAIRISVGTADAPTLGPPATTVRNVSLRGPDLMRGPAAAAPATPPAVQRAPG